MAKPNLYSLGLFLLSLMDENTSILVTSLYIFIIGLGIGLTMQVLTLVVQNTASYADLGTATSAVTFFRTLGMSFGASVMGTLYSNKLSSDLPGAIMSAKLTIRRPLPVPSACTNSPTRRGAHHPRLRRRAAQRVPLGGPGRDPRAAARRLHAPGTDA